MTHDEQPQDDSDESFLDLVFERAVAALEEGASLSVSELLQGREELRCDVESLIADARATACLKLESLPKVRGYTVLEELGHGGMGTVYLARQETLGGRRVALKLLPASAAISSRARERFVAEARTIANVRHANVVTVHDVIDDGAVCAYAMEWVDGASLSQLIQRVHAATASFATPDMSAVRQVLVLDAARAAETYVVFMCRAGIAIARALGALHRAGLVHRDVKPSNVLLRRDGTALLSDFGLVHTSDAALTKGGQFVGTILYASPEQLDGEPESLDARSDVFALGVTLYQALSLHLPFDAASSDSRRATTPTGMLRLFETRSAAPLRSWNAGLPRDLETIVATAIDPNPALRYVSADALADDLERLLSLQPIHARPASALSRATKFVRRNRSAARGVMVGSVVSLALALAAVVFVFFVPRWVDEHVSDARLVLLDPAYANLLFAAEQFGVPSGAPRQLLSREGIERSLASYDAALRWARFDASIQAERDVVARALEADGADAPAREPRLAGLAAYLAGDIDGALEHWTKAERLRVPRATPDPLLEALLGVLLLVRDEPARSYPRLREACRAFPDVGFLSTYHADAAVRCGDFEAAERLLNAAREMPRLDPLRALERVTADLYAATGRDEEAERLYRNLASAPVASLHHARFLAGRDRLEEAIERYLSALSSLHGADTQREYAAVLERWWSSLSNAERAGQIAATLDLLPSDPRSLVARLRHLPPASPDSPSRTDFAFFATLRHWRSSPPLESLGLPELADNLEVEDMQRWNLIRTYSRPLKQLQLLAWRCPASAHLSKFIERSHLVIRERLHVAAMGALLTGAAAGQSVNLDFEATGPGGNEEYGSLDSCACGVHLFPLVRDGFSIDVVPSDGLPSIGRHFHESDSINGGGGSGPKIPDRPSGSRGVLWRDQEAPALHPVVFVRTASRALFELDSIVVGGNSADTSGTTHVRVTASLAGSTLAVEDLAVTIDAYDQYSGPGLGALQGLIVDKLEFVALSTSPTHSYFQLDDMLLTLHDGIAASYCTAGTTTNSCNASMSATGAPSIAATSGFTLSCTGVEGLKQGLIFYGVSGPKASVWSPGSSSYLCVKAPVQRTPADSSGGTAGACDGAFSIDFLDYLATHPTALGQPFSAGVCVNAQAWFRDPPAPGTTNLSNGLQFTTCP